MFFVIQDLFVIPVKTGIQARIQNLDPASSAG